MIALDLVRKRTIIKIAAIFAAVGSLGVGSMSIIAFLGRQVGTFTVSVDDGEVSLALDEERDFKNPQTLLRADCSTLYTPGYTYESVLNRLREEGEDANAGIAKLDQANSVTPSNVALVQGKNGETSTLDFFKYSFFLKNSGSITASYIITFKIEESEPDSDGRYLDDVLRVMIFDHDAFSDEHDYKVYAKKSKFANIGLDGNTTYQEFISVPPSGGGHAQEEGEREDEKHRLAEKFDDNSKTITSYARYNFAPNAIRRYTLVAWIEGYDPEAWGKVPVGASIRLGVEINAHEN